jgi:hypothetical protein
MIKRKHIEHAEVLELGKMLLLIIKRQQLKLNLSSLTELDKQTTEIKKIARAS